MTLSASHPASTAGPRRRRGSGRLFPTALVVFGIIPIAANALRRVVMVVGAESSASGGAGMPLPVGLVLHVHVLGGIVFVVLGALQFSADFRRRRPRWHRIAGRLAVVGALLAAASGLWLAFASLRTSSELLFAFRLLAATGLAVSISLGLRAIRHHRLPAHRAWMIRAFALGLGASTQVFTLGFGEQLFGKGEFSVAVLNGAGWAINLAVAEWAIRRGALPAARPGVDQAETRQ